MSFFSNLFGRGRPQNQGYEPLHRANGSQFYDRHGQRVDPSAVRRNTVSNPRERRFEGEYYQRAPRQEPVRMEWVRHRSNRRRPRPNPPPEGGRRRAESAAGGSNRGYRAESAAGGGNRGYRAESAQGARSASRRSAADPRRAHDPYADPRAARRPESRASASRTAQASRAGSQRDPRSGSRAGSAWERRPSRRR